MMKELSGGGGGGRNGIATLDMLDMFDGHWQVCQGALGALPQRGSGYKLANSLLRRLNCGTVDGPKY